MSALRPSTPYRGNSASAPATTPYRRNLTSPPTEATSCNRKRQGFGMARRYTYARIDHLELSRRLDALGVSVGQLSRATGADVRRAHRWLDGAEDIPPHIDLITRTWEQVPGALAEAKAWADETAQDARPVTE